MWRSDNNLKKIIETLVDDIEEYNRCEVEARNKELKKSFDFTSFSKAMKEGL